MPSRIDLPMPPGDPEALTELAQDTAGAAYRLTVLGNRLAGPAAAAPGWIGDDAVAATAQIGRVAVLTREYANAVLEATGRLRAHVDCLRDARRAVQGLREEQDADFRAAWRLLGRIADPQLAVMTGAPEWVGVIEDVEAAEASRRRRHAALLEEVEDDAAATARVLAQACGVVGGTGVRGDAGRVVAYLAAELPGWGDLELARRGRAAADAISGGDFGDLEASARSVLVFAGSAPFADALLAGLGVDGVRWLLRSVGQNSPDGVDDVSRLVASALSGASGAGPAATVLGADYLRSENEEFDPSTLAGLAAVLAASRSVPSARLPSTTVAAWARQLLLYEHDKGYPGVAIPPAWGPEFHDPAAVALGILAERADPTVCAELLQDVRIWETSLARFWPDEGQALAEVVAYSGQEPGVAGARAVRNGLAVVGAGLAAGDAPEHPVTMRTVAAVSSALGSGVAAHVEVVARSLAASADGQLPDYSRDLLRGLGIASRSGSAAAMIEESLTSWVDAQSPVDEGLLPLAVAVPSAYGVALNYGYRLPYVLEEEAQRDRAERTRWIWDRTVGSALLTVKRPVVGIFAQALADQAADWVGADGSWDPAVDPGQVISRENAIDAAVAAMSPHGTDEQLRVLHQARASFDGATRVIGYPAAPVPPDGD